MGREDKLLGGQVRPLDQGLDHLLFERDQLSLDHGPDLDLRTPLELVTELGALAGRDHEGESRFNERAAPDATPADLVRVELRMTRAVGDHPQGAIFIDGQGAGAGWVTEVHEDDFALDI